MDYQPLDFSTTNLPEYSGHYCKIIDNLFTHKDCADLIALAESDSSWAQAAVHYGLGATQNYVDTTYRNSDRILRFDHDAATSIYNKLRPHIPEIFQLTPHDDDGYGNMIVGSFPPNCKFTLCGLNERLSFLRYEPGNYFRPHCDGRLQLPDGRKSLITLQIYLGNSPVKGGATRFWSSDRKRYFDVEPKPGRVLIFQQRGLWHSGEDVTQGYKFALRTDFMFLREPLE